MQRLLDRYATADDEGRGGFCWLLLACGILSGLVAAAILIWGAR